MTWQGEAIVDCPVEAITSGRRVRRPARRRPPAAPRPVGRVEVDPHAALLRLLGGLGHASREYLYRHYDSEVQARTWLRPGEGDAVVIRAHPERALGIAFAVGGDPRWCATDPELGARHAVAEAARNVACAGGEPIGATNNLNFGNPERPEIMWQFGEAVRGIGDSFRALDVPITGGNVNLYNEAQGRAIFPTPVLGVVGLIRDVARTCTRTFKRAGAAVVVFVSATGAACRGVRTVIHVTDLDPLLARRHSWGASPGLTTLPPGERPGGTSGGGIPAKLPPPGKLARIVQILTRYCRTCTTESNA